MIILSSYEEEAFERERTNRPVLTVKAYASDWKLWLQFHDHLTIKHGRPLPTTIATRGLFEKFVLWLDTEKKSACEAMRRRITGVKSTIKSNKGYVADDASSAAYKLIATLEKDPARAARGRGRANTVTVEELNAMGTLKAERVIEIRNQAMNKLHFKIAGRSSHVSNLDRAHVTYKGRGIRVWIAATKGSKARTVQVQPEPDPSLCAIVSLERWFEIRGDTPGPLFTHVDRWGNIRMKRLSPQRITDLTGEIGQQAGVKADLTGHSMRRSLIQISRQQGRRIEKIMDISGHKRGSRSFWDYVDEADQEIDNAGEGLLSPDQKK